MIDFKSTKDLPGYTVDRPAVRITHTLNRSDLAAAIDLAVRYYGEDWVMGVMGKDSTNADGLYMVSVDGERAPRKVHHSRKAAEDEAHRLTNQPGERTVRVLQLVKTVTKQISVSEVTFE